MSTLDWVDFYLGAGMVPVPVREPGEQYRTKEGPQVANGKVPAIRWRGLGDMDQPPPEVSELRRYWEQHPQWGIALVLRPSGLVIIDCDSPEAVAEAIENTDEPCNNVILSSSGAHMVYRRPAGCPALRAIQRGTSRKIDVLADGIEIVPPSMHKSGRHYSWHRQGELQDAPSWAVGLLLSIRERSFVSAGVDPSKEEPFRLTADQSAQLRARDQRVYRNMLGLELPQDRSRAIWLAMNTLIRLDYTDAQIGNLIWYSALGEKPRQRGIAWLGDEIARARLELTPG